MYSILIMDIHDYDRN